MTNVNNVKVGSREFNQIKNEYPSIYEQINKAFDDGQDVLALTIAKQTVILYSLKDA